MSKLTDAMAQPMIPQPPVTRAHVREVAAAAAVVAAAAAKRISARRT